MATTKVTRALGEDQIIAIRIDQTDGATIRSISEGIQLGGNVPTMFHMPAVWAAAAITFQVSLDDSTYLELFDAAGNAISITATASDGVALDSAVFRGAKYLKIRSGTVATPVIQAAATDITTAFGNPTGIA